VLEILDSAYVQFRDFPLNAAALVELQGSAESYAFEHFRQETRALANLTIQRTEWSRCSHLGR
jgi:hypothetical protein